MPFSPISITHLKASFPSVEVLRSMSSVYRLMHGDMHWLLHGIQLPADFAHWGP